MHIALRVFAATAVLGHGLPALAQPFLFVTGRTQPAVYEINAATGHIVATLTWTEPGARVTDVAVDPKGARLYVSVEYSPDPALPPTQGTLDVFTLDTLARVARLTGLRSYSVTTTPAGDRVIWSVIGVQILDATTLSVVGTPGPPGSSVGGPVVVSRDGVWWLAHGKNCNACKGYGVVSIDPTTYAVTPRITGGGMMGFDSVAVSSDSRVIAGVGPGVTEVDPYAAVYRQTRLSQADHGGPAARAALTPRAQWMTVGSLFYGPQPTDGLLVYPGTDTLGTQMALGSDLVLNPLQFVPLSLPQDLELAPSGTELYVATGDGLVSLDTTSYQPRVLAAIAGGVNEIAIAPPAACLYEVTPQRVQIANAGAGTLSIPAGASCTWSVSQWPDWLRFRTPTSGAGPSTVAFTVVGSAPGAPRTGTIVIGGQAITVEQRYDELRVVPSGPAAVYSPLVLQGAAVDVDGRVGSGPGVDVVHVWAYPATGAPPVFVGAALLGDATPDLATRFDASYGAAGFHLTVDGLQGGTYRFVAYAHSSRSNAFTRALSTGDLFVQPGGVIALDSASLTGPLPIAISGYALYRGSASGTGVDTIHVWAYQASGAPSFLGVATLGISRADAPALYGSTFANAGFRLDATGLAPGSYTLVVYAHNAVRQVFDLTGILSLTVPDPVLMMNIDLALAPGPSGIVRIAGWALERPAGSGTGVGTVHVWAFPRTGASPVFLGASYGCWRPDVGAAFGSQYASAGFDVVSSLGPGEYDVVAYAFSIRTGAFNNTRAARLTVR